MRHDTRRLIHSFAFFVSTFAIGCGGGDSATGSGNPTGEPSGGGNHGSSTTGHPTSTHASSGTGGHTGSSSSTTASGTGGSETGGGGEAGGGGAGQGGMGQGGDGGGGGCVDACTPGASVCDGNATRSCVSIAGCAVLSDPVACPGAKVCSGGACVDMCSNQCMAGKTQCAGDQIQTCEAQASGCTDFSLPTACQTNFTCVADKCVLACTDKCNDGDKQCAGSGVQTCALQSNGCHDFGAAVACATDQTCASGVCQTCHDGDTRCDASGDVEECASGHFQLYKSCAFGCNAGACATSVSCTPGTHSCDGHAIQICNSSGTAELYSQTCSVACSSGLCTGACTPSAKRCNGSKVETCSGDGTAWATSATCAVGCDDATTQCALDKLDITTNTNLDGEIVVNGPVVIHAGATLNSPSGNLTIRATSITVELNASIAAAPTGDTQAGRGYSTTTYPQCGASGGGYGTVGGNVGSCGFAGGPAFGSTTDATVEPGARGGNNPYYPTATGGFGGGVIRLIATTINVAGQITANGAPGNAGAGASYGGGGGGSGGGILIAGTNVTMSGTLSAVGGGGGAAGMYPAGSGAQGRIKILSLAGTATGTVNGVKTQGLLPPLKITSSTHPNPTLVYNDDFPVVAVTWDRPFATAQGYYQRTTQALVGVPTPANAAFDASELAQIDRSLVAQGSNWFHVVSIDPMSNVGAVENQFKIQVNTQPPVVNSTSHPSQVSFSANRDAFFAWTLPTSNADTTGVYYVLDHFGRTVPTKSATFLPVAQKNILLTSLANGVWGFHVVAKDQQGYLTKLGGHYVVRIGPDPMNGNVLGTVTDAATSAVISGATVSVNDALVTADHTTDAQGNYNFSAPSNVIPAGAWEVEVSKAGYKTKKVMITVTANMPTTANVSLDH